jgi:glutathione S-transferase
MENQVCNYHHPDVRIDACLEMTHVKESFSTTKRYPIGRNGSSSPTSRKWLNASVRHTPLCGAAASRYIQSPSFATLLRTGAFPGRFKIALNLERLYPHSPKLFPPGTEDLITDFDDKFLRSVATALVPLLLSRIWTQLGGGSKDYFRTTRERIFRGSLETFSAPSAATAARWIAVSEALEPFARDADARGASDTFLLGERETYADVVAACWLSWARRMWGANTQEWAALETWHGGQWGRLTRAFHKWEYVDTSAPDSAKCAFLFLD